MKRYRIWEANREVFLYPENWLIESERPNRTETYHKFEQEVRQGQSTADYLETVVLNYIDRLDGLSHLIVTGTCQDPATGSDPRRRAFGRRPASSTPRPTRQRLVRLVADSSRHQGPPGDPRRLSGPSVRVLDRDQARERTEADRRPRRRQTSPRARTWTATCRSE